MNTALVASNCLLELTRAYNRKELHVKSGLRSQELGLRQYFAIMATECQQSRIDIPPLLIRPDKVAILYRILL